MIIIIIVFILMKGSSSQSISWFRVFSISFSCRQYGVVEEDVDTIGVEVALNYTGVTNPAYKWTLMDVVFSRNSMKIKSP
ncbi:hypothetical protein BgiMline_026360, partial [Biomphalaria glabrata]